MPEDIRVYELAVQILVALITVVVAPVVAAALKIWTTRALRGHRAQKRQAPARPRDEARRGRDGDASGE
jgi:hypothetical protein